jgi:hypothetical protein
MLDLHEVREGYATFLAQYPWQWFVTLTFKESQHPESAEKKFRSWVHRLNQSLFGRGYRKRGEGVYWVLALEYHKSDAIHFHALLGYHKDLNQIASRRDWRNDWYKKHGLCRVDGIDDKLFAVTNYVSKYVVKGGDLTLCDHLGEFTTVQKHF